MTLFGTTLPGYLLLKFQGRSGSCFDVVHVSLLFLFDKWFKLTVLSITG